MIFIARVRAEEEKTCAKRLHLIAMQSDTLTKLSFDVREAASDLRRSDALAICLLPGVLLAKLSDASKISVEPLRFEGRFQQTRRLTDQSDSIDSIVAFLGSFRIDKARNYCLV